MEHHDEKISILYRAFKIQYCKITNYAKNINEIPVTKIYQFLIDFYSSICLLDSLNSIFVMKIAYLETP